MGPARPPFRRGFEAGDLVVLGKDGEYRLGHVVVVKSPDRDTMVAHTFYKTNGMHFRDFGDAAVTESKLVEVEFAVVGDKLMETSDPALLDITPGYT